MANAKGKRRKKKSRLKEVLRQLRKNKLAVAGAVVIILLVLVAIFAPHPCALSL